MAILSLLFKREPRVLEIQAPRPFAGEGGKNLRTFLKIDAFENIQHQHEAEITENPIETGSLVSDHMDVKPKVLTFTGLISEAPISIQQATVGNVAGSVGGLAGGLLGPATQLATTAGVAALGGSLMNKPGNRVLDGFRAIEELQAKKIPVTIITGLRAYENMVLTSFTPTESAPTGRSLSFTATFREIRMVSSKRGSKRKFDRATAASAASLANLGTVVAPERATSVLSGLTGIGR